MQTSAWLANGNSVLLMSRPFSLTLSSIHSPLPSALNLDVYRRFNITAQAGGSATTDYRNEANTYGYIVEIDPFDPGSRPQKRTALGRFVHEGCWTAPAISGRPLVFYMGDDNRFDYIYTLR